MWVAFAAKPFLGLGPGASPSSEPDYDQCVTTPADPTRPLPTDPVRLPREIWVLVAAAVAIALGYGIVAPVLPRFAKSFDVTTTAATIVVSAFAFMRMSFAPGAGRLMSVFGERNLYLSGIAVVAASSLASAFANGYWQLLIYRALGGIGSITFTVAAMSLIIRLSPPHARGRASAAYGAGFLIGNITGPAAGALLSGLGFRWPFIIYAGFLVIAMTIVSVLIPRSVGARPKKAPTADAALAHDETGPTVVGKNLDGTDRGGGAPGSTRKAADEPELTVAEALKMPKFRLALVTNFAQGWTNMGVRSAVVPLAAEALPGAPDWLPGVALAAFAVGNGIALTRSGRWSDLYGRRLTVIGGLVTSGVFTIALGFATGWLVFVATSVFAGLGSGFVQPSQQGTVADIVGPRKGGRVVSFFQQSGDLGTILGPILCGLIVDFLNFTVAFAVSGAILLVAAIAWWRLGERPEGVAARG